jgi:adenosylhomocysteinase
MPDRHPDMVEFVQRNYSLDQYPALAAQWHAATSLSPLNGLHVLDATPVFTNTVVKYAALLAAGVNLTVGLSTSLPHDPQVVASLREWGVPVVTESAAQSFDIVMDCAGAFSAVPARVGYVELTRSGVAHYLKCPQPVVIADDGQAKLIENVLGTADGWVRAMTHFGEPIGPQSRVVLFGYGKVGRGVSLACQRLDVTVVAIDPVHPQALHPEDTAAIRQALGEATCVVTATGVTGAVIEHTDQLHDSQAVLANLGATDEYGPQMPASRVLNGKAPVNFALEEPTQLPYIDPTMALVNASAADIAAGRVTVGHRTPLATTDADIVATVRSQGLITDEVDALLQLLNSVD